MEQKPNFGNNKNEISKDEKLKNLKEEREEIFRELSGYKEEYEKLNKEIIELKEIILSLTKGNNKDQKQEENKTELNSTEEDKKYPSTDEEIENKENIKFSELDELFEDAAKLVVNTQHGSTALIQRKLALGYNRALRIMDQMEQLGIVGPAQGGKSREVLIYSSGKLDNILKSIKKKENSENKETLEQNDAEKKISNEKSELEKINIKIKETMVVHNNSVLHGAIGGFKVKESEKSYYTAVDLRSERFWEKVSIQNGKNGDKFSFKENLPNGVRYHKGVILYDHQRGAGMGYVAYSVIVDSNTSLTDDEIYNILENNLNTAYDILTEEGSMRRKDVYLKDIEKNNLDKIITEYNTELKTLGKPKFETKKTDIDLFNELPSKSDDIFNAPVRITIPNDKHRNTEKRYIPFRIIEEANKNETVSGQTAKQISNRGGYSDTELDAVYPNWRNEVAELLSKEKSETKRDGRENYKGWKTSYHYDIETDGKSMKIAKARPNQTPMSLYELKEKDGQMVLFLLESNSITKMLGSFGDRQLEPLFNLPKGRSDSPDIKLMKTIRPAKFKKEGEFWILEKKGEVEYIK